jgi:2-polyprenyl-3-methyl-5-hydroxy-6-metoxy-1,4-benzoquinol methylase
MTLYIDATTNHEVEDYPLNPSSVDALWAMEDKHFWHKARAAWILRALVEAKLEPPASLLEVGCGSGAVLRELVRAGYRVTGVDTAEPLVRKAHERCPDADVAACHLSALPASMTGPFDGLGFFDVLEHLTRPEELLRSASSLTRRGATVVVTVPALGSLQSSVDVVSGHKRRYERGEISALFTASGIEPIVEYGIFRATSMVQRVFRLMARKSDNENNRFTAVEAQQILVSQLRVPPAFINRMLGAVCSSELRLGFSSAASASGASLLAVGRVRGES